MRQLISNTTQWLLKISLVAVITLGFAFSPLMTQVVSAADQECKTKSDILGIPTWYRNLVDSDCNVQWPQGNGGDANGIQQFITIIALNISDMVARIAGVLTVAFIIYGGFKYILAQGEPAKVAAAKKTITNAMIGLIISVLAVGIVSLVMGFFVK